MSIQAQGASLRELLGVIALKTGVEIRMSPEVEQQVSVNVEKQPLSATLKSLSRSLRLNRVMIFGERADGSALLLRMKFLPRGKKDSDSLDPVVTVEQEVVARSRRSPQMVPPAADLSAARWQDRLQELPESQQQHLEELGSRLEEKNAARAAHQNQRKADREARHAEREAHRAERMATKEAAHPKG